MPPCYTLLNHEPTPEQREDLRSHWEAEIVLPPEEVKQAWASISPEGELTSFLLGPFLVWLEEAPPGSLGPPIRWYVLLFNEGLCLSMPRPSGM